MKFRFCIVDVSNSGISVSCSDGLFRIPDIADLFYAIEHNDGCVFLDDSGVSWSIGSDQYTVKQYVEIEPVQLDQKSLDRQDIGGQSIRDMFGQSMESLTINFGGHQ